MVPPAFGRALRIVAALVLVGGDRAAAQLLPTEPLVFGNGRVTIAGEVAATYGCADDGSSQGPACGRDTGYFNYTDYELSTFRLFSVGVSASINAGRHLAVLGELRSDNGSIPEPYGLFARIRPWPARRFDIQVGRIPPTFGAFGRRRYPTDNLLIGYPLAYQYLTSLRPDALPATADELLLMRGRGWLSNYSVGNLARDRGVPLISALRWDTGVQVHAGVGAIDGAVAITSGTLANPLVGDDNSGKQVAGRVTLQPTPGLVIGASLARGPFVADSVVGDLFTEADLNTLTQTALGADLEYSHGYYLVRAETIVSDWRLPVVESPAIGQPLRAVATSLEGRYRLRPGLYAAARVDHLHFSTIVGSGRRDEWDAPVTRLEVGGGYSFHRNLLFKASFQRNTRDTTRVPWLNVVAAQVVVWF